MVGRGVRGDGGKRTAGGWGDSQTGRQTDSLRQTERGGSGRGGGEDKLGDGEGEGEKETEQEKGQWGRDRVPVAQR